MTAESPRNRWDKVARTAKAIRTGGLSLRTERLLDTSPPEVDDCGSIVGYVGRGLVGKDDPSKGAAGLILNGIVASAAHSANALPLMQRRGGDDREKELLRKHAYVETLCARQGYPTERARFLGRVIAEEWAVVKTELEQNPEIAHIAGHDEFYAAESNADVPNDSSNADRIERGYDTRRYEDPLDGELGQ